MAWLPSVASPKVAHSLPHPAPKDLCLRLHAGRTWVVSYLHTVKNLSLLPMEGVEVVVAIP